MTARYAPQVIDCPDPSGCGVAAALPQLQTFTLPRARALYRVYDGTWGYDEHNPGFGDSRFAPIDDPATGIRLPSMYLCETPATVLLETVFHDVHDEGSNVIYEQHLSEKPLAHVRVPVDATPGDRRDSRLADIGCGRNEVAASPAGHHSCTRPLTIGRPRQA